MLLPRAEPAFGKALGFSNISNGIQEFGHFLAAHILSNLKKME